ncbi:SoxR reducing system RseC family protein [Paucibacter sp. O1-1]|nr:SoxR reducing system RseC family protein [Paucibacter sp. O1-1]MDA3826176.1 SoxR reducing system RseC family protein [Paucibacter sp. O1-1]
MHELKKLIGNVTTQLYGSAAIRCLMLAVSAFLLLSAFAAHQYLLPLAGALAGLGVGMWLTGFFQNKSRKRFH